MLSTSQFEIVKDSVCIINCGRGPVIDEKAMIHALQTGQIAAAGLDVLEKEPPDPDNPLIGMDNVIITPHSAGASMAGFQRGFILYQENLRRYLQGEKLLNVVNIERGY